MAERNILDKLAERLENEGVPFYFSVATGEKHNDDNSDIVITWNNLENKNQFQSLIDMIKRDHNLNK